MRRLKYMDGFDWFVTIALLLLAVCLVAVIAEGIHIVITGTPLIGEWIVIGGETCR